MVSRSQFSSPLPKRHNRKSQGTIRSINCSWKSNEGSVTAGPAHANHTVDQFESSVLLYHESETRAKYLETNQGIHWLSPENRMGITRDHFWYFLDEDQWKKPPIRPIGLQPHNGYLTGFLLHYTTVSPLVQGCLVLEEERMVLQSGLSGGTSCKTK